MKLKVINNINRYKRKTFDLFTITIFKNNIYF